MGDSSIFLLRNGQLCRLNRYQNGLNQEYMKTIRAGTMNPRAARNYDQCDALTHFVGMHGLDDMDFNRNPIPLKAHDVLLVCSDGISGYMSEQALKDSLTGGSTRDMCSRLEENIKAEMSEYQDNYTAVAVRCLY